uniref:Cytochrome b5 heme-binding domain-containing protein n=1 Tax=Periophthalmus magnuspinnatus TaxID=409849 RepID=A0A3B4BIB7_9GOBI
FHETREKRVKYRLARKINQSRFLFFGSGVYDITEFVAMHPGGDKIMLAAGGAVDRRVSNKSFQKARRGVRADSAPSHFNKSNCDL